MSSARETLFCKRSPLTRLSFAGRWQTVCKQPSRQPPPLCETYPGKAQRQTKQPARHTAEYIYKMSAQCFYGNCGSEDVAGVLPKHTNPHAYHSSASLPGLHENHVVRSISLLSVAHDHYSLVRWLSKRSGGKSRHRPVVSSANRLCPHRAIMWTRSAIKPKPRARDRGIDWKPRCQSRGRVYVRCANISLQMLPENKHHGHF